MKGNTFLFSKNFTVSNLTRAGILISMSLVLNLIFMIYIPVAGFPTVKFTLSAAITMITGIVCGPALGMASGAIVDILTCIIRPAGPYFPGFTIAAMLTGLIPALIFKCLRNDKLNYNFLNTVFIALLSGGCVGAFIMKGVLTIQNNMIYYNEKPLHVLLILAFIALVAAYIMIPIIITKKLRLNIKIDKILFVVSVTQFITSIILNTYFLSVLYGNGFLFFLPSRVLSNFFIIPIYSVLIATILESVNKRFKINL